MTSAQILSFVQVNCLFDFFCFLFILYTIHYIILAIKFFLIKISANPPGPSARGSFSRSLFQYKPL